MIAYDCEHEPEGTFEKYRTYDHPFEVLKLLEEMITNAPPTTVVSVCLRQASGAHQHADSFLP